MTSWAAMTTPPAIHLSMPSSPRKAEAAAITGRPRRAIWWGRSGKGALPEEHEPFAVARRRRRHRAAGLVDEKDPSAVPLGSAQDDLAIGMIDIADGRLPRLLRCEIAHFHALDVDADEAGEVHVTHRTQLTTAGGDALIHRRHRTDHRGGAVVLARRGHGRRSNGHHQDPEHGQPQRDATHDRPPLTHQCTE